MSDFLLAYTVPGVPGLEIGIGDTGSVTLVIADQSVTVSAPSAIDSLQQVLEQVRVDQDGVYRQRFPELYEAADKRAREQREARRTRPS